MLEAKETDTTNITPATNRTNSKEACLTEESLFHFLLLRRKVQLWGKQTLLTLGTTPIENLVTFFLLCVSENENLDSVMEKHFQFETCSTNFVTLRGKWSDWWRRGNWEGDLRNGDCWVTKRERRIDYRATNDLHGRVPPLPQTTHCLVSFTLSFFF